MADIFDFSQPPMKFVPEPPPHVIPCKGSGSTQAIIEHDGGVPE
jgi:hypothetical protein